MNVPIRFSKRTRSKSFLHSGSMKPIKQDSQNFYRLQREEQDRRIHFGDSKGESENNVK